MALLNHHRFQKFLAKITWNKAEKGLIPVLEHVAKLGIDVDLQEIIQCFTFDSTCILVLSHDPASLSIDLPNFPYKQAFADAEESILDRHVFPEIRRKLQKWLQIGKEKKLSRAQHIIYEFLAQYTSLKREKLKGINQTLDYQEGYFDFLAGYMKALEEKGGATDLPEKAWRDTLMNLIFAGKDTIGASLTWFFWLLATNPIEENKIREEILANLHVKEDGRWNFSKVEDLKKNFSKVEDLKKLTYLHGALCEALRLFPPVGLQHKAPIQLDILPSGHCIKPNTKTVLSFYSMARMETIWGEDCSEQGGIKHVPSFKFTAFNAGPRSCLGKEMAFIQMKIVAAVVVYHFQIKIVEGHPISPSNSVILNMKHGLKFRVFRRCDL